MPVIAISADDGGALRDMARETGAPFDFLSDADGILIEQLGIADPAERERGTIAFPSTFMLDSESKIRFRYQARSPEDRPKAELLMLAAERLR